jgi:hypothetical protein
MSRVIEFRGRRPVTFITFGDVSPDPITGDPITGVPITGATY